MSFKMHLLCLSIFNRGFSRRDPLKVVEEIEYWTTQYRINNIAFYDDALLIEPFKTFYPYDERGH